MYRLLRRFSANNPSPARRRLSPRSLRVERMEERLALSGNVDLAQAVASGIAGIPYDGAGVKVGVISTGIAHRAAVASDAELPSNITVHPTLSGSPTEDKGTAMLEVVHNIAPGAQLYFAGYPTSGARMTTAQMRDAIDWMVNSGVDVIVDALDFYDEPFFEDGVGTVSEKVKQAIEEGVTYVSAAGDAANRHYQGRYLSSGGSFPLRHDFDPGTGTDAFLRIQVPPQAEIDIVLQWSDPWGTSANDYTLTLWNDPATSAIASSTNTQNGSGNPFEKITGVRNTGTQNAYVNVSVVKSATALARELEIFITESKGAHITDDEVVADDSIQGHKAASGVITVGAIEPTIPLETVWQDSSRGPSTTISNFTSQTKVPRNSLTGVAVHSVQTRVGQLGHFANPFTGSAASAAHTAGIVALMQHAHQSMSAEPGPMLTPAQISTILKNTAVDIGTAGYDATTGAGRFDAAAAVNAVGNQPKVARVTIGNSANPTAGDAIDDRNSTTNNWGQLASAMVGGANQISITFTEPVTVHQSDLVIRGNGGFGAVIPSTGFAYNSETNTATWSFATIYRDQLWLTLDGSTGNAVTDLAGNRLDGEWTNPSSFTDNDADSSIFPSGNGVAGGNFTFAVTVLSGDVDRDGRVTLVDVANLQRNFGKTTGAIWNHGDLTGDGQINAADAAMLVRSFGADFRTCPTVAGSPAAADAVVVAAVRTAPESLPPRTPVAARLRRDVDSSANRPSLDANDRAISEIATTAASRIQAVRSIRRAASDTAFTPDSGESDTSDT
jgi:hypothetical protein